MVHCLLTFDNHKFFISVTKTTQIRLAMIGLNFQHDTEALAEIQRGGALACDLEVLDLEITKFFVQNQEHANILFLHYSYDENVDGVIGQKFVVAETR